jgi:hypothetical protein
MDSLAHFVTAVVGRWYLYVVGGPFILDQSLKWLSPRTKAWLDDKWPPHRRRWAEVTLLFVLLMFSTFQAFRQEYQGRDAAERGQAAAKADAAYWRGRATAAPVTPAPAAAVAARHASPPTPAPSPRSQGRRRGLDSYT